MAASTSFQALSEPLTSKLKLPFSGRWRNDASQPRDGALVHLENLLAGYLAASDIQSVKRAYYFAEQAHYGQTRRSGEPYVTHPLAVATILAEMHMDHQSLMAGLLHDVIEDTGVTKVDIGARFGQEVAELVDGVSKFTFREFESAEHKQAENFQKMAMAMAKDIRVILVKLADRLHNMRTLGVLSGTKARRIATETLEIYAPIAMRLGMNEVRMEFEDLGLKALYPMRARRLQAAREAVGGNRKTLMTQIQSQLEAAVATERLSAQVIGREKHLYSIYQKMRMKRKSFKDIMDIYAFRIIVNSADECYRALGIVHSVYKPIPGEFKDYIAIPKANGYQSLHTVLKGMHGVPIEIQIRTQEMEDMANNGIAAHWLYKTQDAGASMSHARAREWVQGLLEMQARAGDSLEFIESVKIDLFPDEVYIFTPKGAIMELPRGASAIDFAYAVHTDVGDRCVACRINGELAPLSEPLDSGQTVEIITSPNARPSPAWFNYVITARARTHIRHYLKNQGRDDSASLGQSILEKSLSGFGAQFTAISDTQWHKTLARFSQKNQSELLIAIGTGQLLPQLVAAHLSGNEPELDDVSTVGSMAISGAEGFAVSYAKCCCPLPGDDIGGYLSPERGLIVHRRPCRNLKELRNQTERLFALRWADDTQGAFPIALRIEIENRRGMFAIVATRLNAYGLNIDKITSQNKDALFTYIDLEFQVESRTHLARVMRRLRSLEGVRKVMRSARR
jgi:guanosine-3',5'-bis(diphosphate) 3'-pyrophosphohydrolase